jgi:hypothetical protein
VRQDGAGPGGGEAFFTLVSTQGGLIFRRQGEERGEDVVKSNIQLGDILADVAGELLGRIGGAAARAAVWLLGRVVERLVERQSPSNILVIVDELFSAVGVREGAVVVKHAQELGDRRLRSLKAEADLIPKPLADVYITC